MLTPEQRAEKRRAVFYVIFLCLCLLSILAYLQKRLILDEFDLPIDSTILIFALVNLNLLLLLLMVYLVLRNMVELFFEHKHRISGIKLKTRMVISYVALAFIPTLLLFFVSQKFVSSNMDYWFNANLEHAIQDSKKLVQAILQDAWDQADRQALRLRLSLQDRANNEAHSWEDFLAEARFQADSGSIDTVEVFFPESRQHPISVLAPRLANTSIPPIPADTLRQARERKSPMNLRQETSAGELARRLTPLTLPESGEILLVTGALIPQDRLQQLRTISRGAEDYGQWSLFKGPIRGSLQLMFLIIFLLILFGAIWFGFYIARGLTRPIEALAIATRRVAGGDLDFVIAKESEDEMGELVDSFNKMTSDLAASNRRLDEARVSLQHSNDIAEQRRRYMEIVLENVAAGVISLDAEGRITTINRFATRLLQIAPEEFLQQDYRQVLTAAPLSILEGLLDDLSQSGRHGIEKRLKVTVGRQSLSLLVHLNRLEDESGGSLGHVIVFDNLTRLEKAQRMAAWRDVACRVAHEIKNPLTPIQLSAQRLRKRFLHLIDDREGVIDVCTKSIIDQVDNIRALVDEFSSFARMAKAEKRMYDLVALCAETITLFRESHGHIRFQLKVHDDPGPFLFDPAQIQRVLINLLQNGVAALPEEGDIEVVISRSPEGDRVLLEVRDNGCGIAPEARTQLFEPYYSTKKSGTGLGLTISSAIIADHDGDIRVSDNQPRGAIFTVELPRLTC
ncbi:MAG: hypothetical protein BWK76_12670 [Desulfobulbaceae bacterium A2]|nr:MAG: hypothetical protein BWK76_12670 [Desulfobulbaceae bacterium A2]